MQTDISEERRPTAALVVSVVVDAGIPLAAYYGLRAAGLNQWWALAVGGTVPLLRAGHSIVRSRRVDPISAFVLVAMVLSTAMSLVTGSPRVLLARESWGTGAFGLWILGSLLGRRPFLLDATAKFMPAHAARRWEDGWRHDVRFRRGLRMVTAVWGGAFLVDAVARVVMAFTMPVDSVPIAGTVLLVALLILVQRGSVHYVRRAAAFAGVRTDGAGVRTDG
ncbi:VC0807 family protein [Streptomyces sp. CT34]|uniref:VC0807 family protein n=1 Tax=Streptomyces sp. CT34 TaxID=1553907 RepID=UPI0007C82DFF|nr:VC0807 family protein [Streptomyces sp. CT34]